MIVCQTSIRPFCKKMFLNYFPSVADMMKCYKGQPQSATENLFYNFPHHLARSQMSTKSIIGKGCEAITCGQKMKTWESQMRKLTAVYSLVVNASEGAREESEKKEVKTGKRKS